MLTFPQLFKKQLTVTENEQRTSSQAQSSKSLCTLKTLLLKSVNLQFMMNKSHILTSRVHLHFVVNEENLRVRIQSERTEQRNSAVSALTHLNVSDWPLHS